MSRLVKRTNFLQKMFISLSLAQQNLKLNSHKSLTLLIEYQVFVVILVQTKPKSI